MLILTLRTDNPTAEIGIYSNASPLTRFSWLAHRELAETIHIVLREQLQHANKKFADTQGIVVYKGPGSFTGLRIGLSVANAFADGLHIPVVGESGQTWEQDGISRLTNQENDGSVMPEYGSEPHITPPRK